MSSVLPKCVIVPVELQPLQLVVMLSHLSAVLPKCVIVPAELQPLQLVAMLGQRVDHVVHVDLSSDALVGAQHLVKGDTFYEFNQQIKGKAKQSKL